MSPQARLILQEEIAPRIAGAVARSVVCIGSEDHQELVQDGITKAAGPNRTALKKLLKVGPAPISTDLIGKIFGLRIIDWTCKAMAGGETPETGSR